MFVYAHTHTYIHTFLFSAHNNHVKSDNVITLFNKKESDTLTGYLPTSVGGAGTWTHLPWLLVWCSLRYICSFLHSSFCTALSWDCFPNPSYNAKTTLTAELIFLDVPQADTASFADLFKASNRRVLLTRYWVKTHKSLGPQRQMCVTFSSQNWNLGCIYAFPSEFRRDCDFCSSLLPMASYKTSNISFSRRQPTVKYIPFLIKLERMYLQLYCNIFEN